MADMRIGFIGLGFMGQGMATNLLAKGFPLTVMAHRRREAVDELVRRGAREAATPAALAADSDVVVLCVTGAAQVDELLRRPAGIAAGARPGLVVIDCTTSDPATILALARDFPQLTFVDSPLGRSPAEAWKGELAVMVGSEPAMLEAIRPVLAGFASTIQHAGPLGSGHKLKLVNNFLALGFGALYAEALVMARKAGLSTEAFDDLVRASRMDSAFYRTFRGWALEGNPRTHPFALRNALKDATYIGDLVATLGLPGRLSGPLRALYGDAVAAGYGEALLPELPRWMAAADGVDLVPLRGPDNLE